MRTLVLATAVAVGASLSGCAATTTTSKVAVDYNRIFSNSRDEVLVDNILRAAAREPLEFSTMGTVTGGVRNSGSITIPFTNLIGKGGLTISPSTTVNDGINPAVTIIPLADKDFTTGVLTPVSLNTLSYFMDQGWDPEMILMLTVGGVVFDDGTHQKLVLNRGQLFEYDDEGKVEGPSPYNAFKKMFGDTPALAVQANAEAEKSIVRMPAKDAFALLKDGVGKDRKIDAIRFVTDKGATSNADVTIVKPGEPELVGLNASSVCDLPGQSVHMLNDKLHPLVQLATPTPKGKAYVLLRSVESIIYFLGETQRDVWRRNGCGSTGSALDKWPDYDRRWLSNLQTNEKTESITFLRINRWCGAAPPPFRSFVETKFNDEHYYVLRSGDARSKDRTLSTLTFLDELISLQTSGMTITSSTPFVTIGAQ